MGLIVLIPYLVKKGINVSGVLTGTTTVLDTADHVVDTLKEFFPEVPVITVIDKVIGLGAEGDGSRRTALQNKQN